MADLTTPAPYETSKVEYLHDQSTRPEAPKREMSERTRYLAVIALGVVISAVLTALAFEARGSWESHRDWVVPAVAPMLAIGGVAFAYLAVRRELAAIIPGFLFAFVALLLLILNMYRGSQTEGPDVGRDVLVSLAGGLIALTVISLVFNMVRIEMKRPGRPPSEGM